MKWAGGGGGGIKLTGQSKTDMILFMFVKAFLSSGQCLSIKYTWLRQFLLDNQ